MRILASLALVLALFGARSLAARADGRPCPAPPPPFACEVVDPCDPCVRPWKVGLGLYLSAQSGNTDSLDVKTDAEVVYRRGPWLAKLAGAYVYGEDDGTRSSENWWALGRGERLFTARDYAFAQVLVESDDFADLEYRVAPVAGYGRVLIKSSRTELKAEVGGGVSIEKRDGLAETSDLIAWIAVHLEHKLPKGAVLKVDADVRPNLEDTDRTVSVLDARIDCPVCKGVTLAVGLRLRHEVEPPGDLDELDTLFTVGLRFTF